MSKQPEVLQLEKDGVPLPTWFAGPIFNGYDPVAAASELQAARDAADPHAKVDDDAPPAF